MTEILLKALTPVWLFAFTFLILQPTTDAHMPVESSHPEDSKSITKIGFSVAAAAGVTALGRWITPIGALEQEIQKLTADENFVRQWMLLNTDANSQEKGKRALANIEKEKKAKAKKLRRTELWAYPLIIVVGTGAMLLTSSLIGD